jgi:RNA polymerase sigma factor (sigma-70 family)
MKLIDIIAGCAQQERQAQKMLYDRYYGFCIKIAFRYMNTYEQAIDTTHDAYLKIFRNIDRFEIRDKDKMEVMLLGWIKRIVINTSIDHIRLEFNNKKTYAIPEDVWEHEAAKSYSDDTVLHKDLITFAKRLPTAYQTVFNLHVIEGYSHPAIAKMLGITTGSSKSNLSRARRHLQKAITADICPRLV